MPPSPTTKKRKRPSDSKDPERLLLEQAHASASSLLFLPDTQSNGVGKLDVPNHHVSALKGLFYLIVGKAKSGVTWGEAEGDQDPRRRMYGFLPQKRDALLEAGIQIQKFDADGANEHEEALQLASVDLVFANHKTSIADNNMRNSSQLLLLVLDESIYLALELVMKKVHSLVPDRYKKYATMEELIAVQPNLHNGASYLPAHLDFPRHDGFGVLIVTIGIRGSGVIVLMDEGDTDDDDGKSFSFRLEEGKSYILCGDARNKCVHGVLCDDEESSQRETLNLRYGLHSAEFAHVEIDQHWPD